MCDQLFESEWAFSRRSQEQGPLGQGHWQPLCRDLVNPLSTNRSSYFARYTHTILRDTILSSTSLNYLAKPFCKTYTRNCKTHKLFCKTLSSSITSLNNFATQKMLNTTKLHYLTSNYSNTHFVSMSTF